MRRKLSLFFLVTFAVLATARIAAAANGGFTPEFPHSANAHRINTAYFYGELQKYPGGGPALARRTIQYNFGVPINYYILINFVGFRKVVDAQRAIRFLTGS